MTDPYKTLGVPKDASKLAVKAAFRKLAKKWHPDKDKDNPLYHQKFQEINEAYSVLMKSKSRKQFNRDDVRNIFKRMRQSSSGYYSTTQSQKTSSFADALDKAKARPHTGTTTKEATSGTVASGAASGAASGLAAKQKSAPSPSSKPQEFDNTSSHIDNEQSQSSFNRDIRYTVKVSPQDAANGTKKRVRLFNGSWVDVKVPPDTKNGQILRLRGKGLLKSGASRGDLLMLIEIDSPEIYRMEDDKVYLDVPITLAEAINGATIPIPTLTGTVLLAIPGDVNNGYTMKIKGKGMLLHEEVRGDLFAIIRIIMPPHADKKLQDFITEWSEKHPYEVREHFGHLV